MKHQFKLMILLFVIFAISCNRRIPQVIYQDKTVTKVDTVEVVSHEIDTIPCADFDISLLTDQHDTVYVQVVDKQISVKYLKRTDTIYKETIIVQPAPLRSITRIDNSVKVKAKQGSAIGDGNKITTKKNNWWWIFLAGVLTWFIVQNVLLRWLKTYFPFFKIFF